MGGGCSVWLRLNASWGRVRLGHGVAQCARVTVFLTDTDMALFSCTVSCFFVIYFLFPPSWAERYPLCSCNFQAMNRFCDSVNTLMYSTVPVPWCMSSCKTLIVLEPR